MQTHLKGRAPGEWEGALQLSLLPTPALIHPMVPHHHLPASLTKSWVDVQGDVLTPQQIDGNPTC